MNIIWHTYNPWDQEDFEEQLRKTLAEEERSQHYPPKRDYEIIKQEYDFKKLNVICTRGNVHADINSTFRKPFSIQLIVPNVKQMPYLFKALLNDISDELDDEPNLYAMTILKYESEYQDILISISNVDAEEYYNTLLTRIPAIIGKYFSNNCIDYWYY
jgi:hypothetical protein